MKVRGRVTWMHVITIIGWLALAVSMLDHFGAGFEVGRIGIAVGPTGSIILALRRLIEPVAQVFEVGRQCGRREAEAESGAQARHLSLVQSD